MTEQNCWAVTTERGFLPNPDPLADFSTVDEALVSAETSQHLQTLSAQIPTLIAEHTLRDTLEKLPIYDLANLSQASDFRSVERAFQIYSHLAQAYIWCENDDPRKHIPAGVAVPFVQLSKLVERPPIIPYAMTALYNWQRLDKDGPISANNMQVIQKLIDIPDESWFHLIHVEIEAHAASAIAGCMAAAEAVRLGDVVSAENALSQLPPAFAKMNATFKRIAKGCDPNVYYHTLRPYLFGFDDIVYEGVAEFGGKPQTFIGETGAQSSVIPVIQNYLGLLHAQGGLSHHLEMMKHYMPKPHRDLLMRIDSAEIRSFVIAQNRPSLNEIYNTCLECIVDFRTLHLHYAQAYIASKVKDPRGTGGTDFMRWLKQLRDETAAQFV